jgi:ABC-type phosphonate transport system ATPase subunit
VDKESRLLLCDEVALRGPNLNLTVLQGQKLLFIIEKDKGLGRIEILYLPDLLRDRIVDLEVAILLLDHDLLVELL